MPKATYKLPTGEVIEREALPIWKTPNNHDTNLVSDLTALYCADPSLTKQEFKDDTDINFILERFARSGEQPPPVLPEHFMDLTTKLTYQDVEQRLADANKIFYELPAAIREESLNSPARWADQVTKAIAKGDGDRLVELGLAAEELKAAKPLQTAPVPSTTVTPPKGAAKEEKPASGLKNDPDGS